MCAIETGAKTRLLNVRAGDDCPGSTCDKPAFRTPGHLTLESPYHLKPQADAIVILRVEIHDFIQGRFLLPFYREKKIITLRVSLILWSNLLSHSSIFCLQLLRCLLIRLKGKEHSLQASVSQRADRLALGGPALSSLSSPPTSSLSSMGLFSPSASHYVTSTTARTPLPALMACRDGVPHSLQPFHAAPQCHPQSQQCIFAVLQWCSAFFSLKWGMRILYIITFKMKNSLKDLSWIALVFASFLTFRLFFFPCNFP